MKKSVVFAALLVPALALAQPKTADDWYKEGEKLYNLGNFDGAAEAFKEGFAAETDESKKSAYLYNVAQAYRQGNKCKDAAFFYKRYLALKDRDTVKPLKPEKRAEIEQRIAELEECARTQEQIAAKPPGDTIVPGGDTRTGGGTGTGTGTTTGTTGGTSVATGGDVDTGEEEEEEEEEADGITSQVFVQPRVLNARFVGGVSKIMMGDLPTGVKPAFGITGGYPVVVQGPLGVDVGASLAFTPMPYENGMTHVNQTSTMTTLLANAAATYTVAPSIALRGDVGLGVLLFSGLDMGNPFTEGGAGTSGSLAMFAARVAASADYAITPNIVATVTPVSFSYSPAKEGLRADVSTIMRLEFMLGVGYRM